MRLCTHQLRLSYISRKSQHAWRMKRQRTQPPCTDRHSHRRSRLAVGMALCVLSSNLLAGRMALCKPTAAGFGASHSHAHPCKPTACGIMHRTTKPAVHRMCPQNGQHHLRLKDLLTIQQMPAADRVPSAPAPLHRSQPTPMLRTRSCCP